MRKYNIIAIERQYASGGRQIGSLVAEKLGIPFYNEEILQMAAEKLNIPADYVQYAEEAAPNSFLYAIAMASNPSNFSIDLQLADKLFYEESLIIKALALKGSCVVVGRCAGSILDGKKDLLNVFIHADDTARMKRAIEEYGVSEKDAQTILSKTDKRRTSFYNAHSAKKWSSMGTYDLCLNSSKLGIEDCAEIITAATGRAL